MTSWHTDVALSRGDGLPRIGDPSGWRNSVALSDQSTGPKILGFGRAISRHAKLLFATVLFLNIVALIGVRDLTPRYTASADLLVGPREEQVVDLKAVLSGLSGSSDVIESEIQVLRSRGIARNVVQSLNLDQMPEFNPTLEKPGIGRAVRDGFASAVEWIKLEVDTLADHAGFPAVGAAVVALLTPSPPINPEASAEPLDALSLPVDRFLADLDVAAKGRSRVITISFTSTNAGLAAKIPNAVADAYVANQLKAKTDATAQAHRWLDERVSELRVQLIAADEAVEAYRRRAGIIPIRDSTLLAQQISEAGQELMRAREQVAHAQGRLASMAGLNPNAWGLQRELASAVSREKSLDANLTHMRQQIDAGSQSEIGLRALQREADADRNLYDRLLARARETKIQSGLQQADATIISRAEKPGTPSFPKASMILPLFFIASCLAGILLVIWLESLDHGFLSVDQLEATLGIPAIGAIPLVKGRFRRWTAAEAFPLTQSKSYFAEAIRNLYTSLTLSGKDETPKTVLIASSLPNEGKSSVSLALTSMMASCGKKVVLVDCDLRDPVVHKGLCVGRGPGLTDYLGGGVQLDAVLRFDPVSSAYFLPAGNEVVLAPDLFASGAMRNLLSELSSRFDLIILDGGPLLGVSDTRHLCRLAERTVFVIRWQDTRRAAAVQGLRQLHDAGAHVAGALLTMIDPKHYKRYSPAGLYRRRPVLSLGS